MRRRLRDRRARRRRNTTLAVAYGLAVLSIAVIGTLVWTSTRSVAGQPTPEPVPRASSTATPPELSAAQRLLLDSGRDDACAVAFAGDGIDEHPVLQTRGMLYESLPIPRREGAVFAGWYSSAEDAATRSIPGRVNGSKLVQCADQEIVLHGAWISPEENVAEDAGIPILMYHQFTINPDGEDNWLRLNYIYTGDFEEQMAYIASAGFYLPTWDELSAFIDGELFLPSHSVIITDDDADWSWFDLGAPIVDEYELLTTSFMVTAWRQDLVPNEWTLRRSHTHDMHRAGANGDGLMVNLSIEEMVADLEHSAEILGAKEVIAYPFGHYNEASKQAVAQAGYEMARTTEQGYVRIGTDKLALPCIRINYGMGVGMLQQLIG